MPTAICPECDEEVYVDADAEQSDVITCDECGIDLVVVGLDPVELDVYDEEAIDDYDDYDDFDDGLDDDEF
jgi:alpha-aminoadipate carrier protein LysW